VDRGDEPPTTGALVWRLAMRWRAAVDRAVAPLGLTHAQYSVLASLRALTHRGARPSQRRLADYTGLEAIYVSKLVRVLERGGLVTRVVDPADARAVQLALTDHGVEVVDRAVTVVRTLNGELTTPLGGPDSPEIRALVRALQTLLRGAPGPDVAPDRGDEPMTTTPLLTGRDVGMAEKATRALLDRLLDEADVAFTSWTVLYTLGTEPGPVAHDELVRRLVHGLKIGEGEARAAVDGLVAGGLVAPAEGTDGLAMSPAGHAVHGPIRQAVAEITAELYGDLPEADLAATRRTLAEVTRRANARLAG
jgi:DNA-binding MarR family transcriptional regulator